jgi:hypothetical protein
MFVNGLGQMYAQQTLRRFEIINSADRLLELSCVVNVSFIKTFGGLGQPTKPQNQKQLDILPQK